ncbi:MAG: hypothetical protein ABSH15_00570 [Verrucomicrobiota bacterium]
MRPLKTNERQIVAELDALQAKVDALKRLQAETPVNKNTGQAAAELDALLPAILPSSLCFAATGDRAFKGEL